MSGRGAPTSTNATKGRGSITYSNARVPAFDHYLRTGEWLSEPEWLSREELKFNPYHDPDDGRFTFAPGGPKGQQNLGNGSGASAGISVGNPKARMPTPEKRPRTRPVPGYPETGKDAWR